MFWGAADDGNHIRDDIGGASHRLVRAPFVREILLVAVALVLAVHLFLWEIHSPEYGFRMPWIQT